MGKDALAETDKIILETAKFIKEDFLQQNSYTSYDKYCPFYKSVEMMRNIVAFHEQATRSIERTAHADTKVTYAMIKARCGGLLYEIYSQKFEDPSDGEEAIRSKLGALREKIVDQIRALEDECK